MLIDARSLPNHEQLNADVCIVGAGAAGISIARELVREQFTVILVEGGGLKFEHRSQFLHRGKSRGRNYPPPENTRRRQFGGTTAAWFGRCRPLDAIDFEARPAIPNSGWPFDKSELDKYAARAADLCQIEPSGFDMAKDPLASTGLESKLFHFSPPTHFGQAYLKDLQEASNMRVVLHANAAEIELDESGTRTTHIRCLTLSRKEVRVAARIFVIAGGGLENPRLLLNSRKVHTNGIANSDDLVGRYFMEHIYGFTAAVESIPSGFPEDYLRLNYESFQRHIAPTPAIGLPEAVLRAEGLPNASAFFVQRPIHKTDPRFYSAGMQGFINLVETLEHRRAPSWRTVEHARQALLNAGTALAVMSKAVQGRLRGRSQYAVHLQIEPIPNRESRVLLADTKDRLGVNQLCVDWRLLPQDLRGMERCNELIVRGLESAGVHTRPIQHERDSEGWPVSMPTSKHHMGTTRMSKDPRSGVVDPDCRVHGIANLYIAGSSVFPTAGMANPTFAIVALAVRLAEHIKRVLP